MAERYPVEAWVPALLRLLEQTRQNKIRWTEDRDVDFWLPGLLPVSGVYRAVDPESRETWRICRVPQLEALVRRGGVGVGRGPEVRLQQIPLLGRFTPTDELLDYVWGLASVGLLAARVSEQVGSTDPDPLIQL